jgi:MoxR-like ATPase
METSGPALEETITLNQAKKLVQCMAHEQSFMFLSAPGVGKSEMVYQAATESGLPCRSLLGTQIAPEDVSGIPHDATIVHRSKISPLHVWKRDDPFFADAVKQAAADGVTLETGSEVIRDGNKVRVYMTSAAPHRSRVGRYLGRHGAESPYRC